MTSQMPPLILAEREQPFWGFAEILLSVAVLLAALGGVIGVASRYFHAPPESGLWSVLEEATAYAILFLALKLMFARHGKGVLDSLAWTKSLPFSPLSLVLTGFAMSLILIVLEYALRTPNVSTPFQQLLDDPASRIAVAIDAITLGPIVEELLFRGFLQPVLTSAIGVFPGILLTSALFGALHLMQNAFVWQSGVLIMIVGFVLGSIRHLTGSTKASTIVHMAYNSTLALSLVAYSASAPHK